MRLQRVCLLGMGLIGGSLGMALTRYEGEGLHVQGWDNSEATREEAIARGAAHAAPGQLMQALDGADLVIIATPIRSILPLIRQVLPALKPGMVVTDVASTKGELAREITQILPPGVEYIGGHPMAGTEGSGIAAADPFLFENAVYILTPTKSTGKRAIAMMEELLRLVGAQPLLLSVEEHDRMVAAVSHLPHLTAISLANAAGKIEGQLPGTLTLAAGGFRDSTRIAMSSPELWAEIVFSNKQQVLGMMDNFLQELTNLRQMIQEDCEEEFRNYFLRGGEVRRQVPQKNKGFLRLLHEMVVQIQDHPGAIAGVINILADAAINIKDIEILRVREGEGGTLRLAVEDEPGLALAKTILTQKGYRVFTK